MRDARRGIVGACLVLACTSASADDGALPATGPAVASPDRPSFSRPSGDLALTASAGMLGSDAIYDLRLAYFALPWLGLEATLAHNPSGSEHAVLHYANAVARYDHPGRIRPFVTAGLGSIEVFPGIAVNAKPVTKLLLDAGAGTLFHLRDDVGLRFEARAFTVLDEQEAHRGAYSYFEWSCGVTFSRSLHTSAPSETGAEP
jgi:hypothetical protein